MVEAAPPKPPGGADQPLQAGPALYSTNPNEHLMSDSEQKERRAKAFAWRAIGCAVWLGIGLFILMLAAAFLSMFFRPGFLTLTPSPTSDKPSYVNFSKRGNPHEC